MKSQSQLQQLDNVHVMPASIYAKFTALVLQAELHMMTSMHSLQVIHSLWQVQVEQRWAYCVGCFA